MPTPISRSQLASQLTERVRDALDTADVDGDGAVNAAERATLPDDVRGVAEGTADHYFAGGPMPKGEYVAAYARFATEATTRADANDDGALTAAEQSSLPASIYNSVLALRAGSAAPPPPSPAPTPPAAGGGTLGISGVLAPSDVDLRPVLSSGLNRPTGIAFDPRDGSLWVVNRGDDSSVVVKDPGGPNESVRKYTDDSDHFMNNPMGLAFSPVYAEMATIQDTSNDYNAGGTGNMFMGPTLWPTDATYDGGAASHLDMLHHSPLSVGIAAGTAYPNAREYWVFNGMEGSIDRYFFGEPHVHGGHDHSDGITVRYGDDALKRGDGVPGHLALDDATGVLYIADTGNGRIAALDTKPDVNRAARVSGIHGETPLYRHPDDAITSVTGPDAGLVRPTGLVLHGDHLVVGDHATGHIKVFTKDGQLTGDLDTGLGPNSITGLAVGPNGKLYVSDAAGDQVLEVNLP